MEEFSKLCANLSSDEEDPEGCTERRDCVFCKSCGELVSKSTYYGSLQYGLCAPGTFSEESSKDDHLDENLKEYSHGCQSTEFPMDLDCYDDVPLQSSMDVESQTPCIQVSKCLMAIKNAD